MYVDGVYYPKEKIDLEQSDWYTKALANLEKDKVHQLWKERWRLCYDE